MVRGGAGEGRRGVTRGRRGGRQTWAEGMGGGDVCAGRGERCSWENGGAGASQANDVPVDGGVRGFPSDGTEFGGEVLAAVEGCVNAVLDGEERLAQAGVFT